MKARRLVMFHNVICENKSTLVIIAFEEEAAFTFVMLWPHTFAARRNIPRLNLPTVVVGAEATSR